ncbi:4Fe-4S dicluster domain-containing protein [Lactonifactor sp. BIOML-A3]|uniref:Coenzyme F420 hydrogenase/dehydrogenase, beta subunit C-terminal domain n=1 Tax=unclassified Lactonifactor TaxID=2636670 RepID=UPI0012AF6662|nr:MULTISPECIES: Coenzyme F420 hydrogenase/dehydrogenase, beta subunit C-terminal domain [unclassified Lactonifactor]MSA01740.1 4Fe-4S dicluster domain-containing protein [Lactonifactor sp. BIOML-A5]MSA08738.1 4Fe-4S dicluster domain-containing protein [Lactonifactor sp. BIOML-A4]MSA13866.1 4Fe-4S dicluster domain-containing protein [Lactonifactor sp. BIOML-A3]MSA17107.1 4Fe-4S dicluster domain-containing protein [Lactonifactor sp. BIOML-A2]MSA37786.1 4Fe-4S dicluster domain-containing protein
MKTGDLFQEYKDCCGCSMCANQCPQNAIEMHQDNQGFLYPRVVENKCISCGKCIKVCPLKKDGIIKSSFISYYCGSLQNVEDNISCASGGMATSISRAFINKGGVVYGAAYTSDYKKIEYIRANCLEDVERLKTSKYAQANKGNIYRKIENDLKSNCKVLFIGLPCDVAAVVSNYGTNSDLYTIELICHGPTSQRVHREYCELQENKYNSTIKDFSTRWKKNGRWTPFYIRTTMKNGKETMLPFHDSSYGAAFKYLKRPSCYSCKIKGEQLQGDMMIGDYHSIEPGMRGYNEHGVSSALIHNEKGQKLIDLIDETFTIFPISEKNAKANRAIFMAISKPEKQKVFEETFIRSGLESAYNLKFVKKTIIKRKFKTLFLKWGVKVKRILIPSSKPSDE